MVKESLEKEILTIKEAAAYLQIGTRSLYRLAREGGIPGKKVLNKWRFARKSLQAWIRRGDKKHWK
ncbi:MAG: helix-turn-helix domain-containing protein [Deltaproteobacteria bacterium]|nr:helix-turn-helix domain-containing protein [Deltaproteobacteria bacterium]